LEIAQRYIDEGGHRWNSGQFAWKSETILREINAYLPEAGPLLARIGEAWDTAERDRVLGELFPRMPKGSIDYKVMQKTSNASSILLPCSWEDMGTHAALAGNVGSKSNSNMVYGKAVVLGMENVVLANTDQYVVVASDGLTVVVTRDAVYVGDRNTDMKALVEVVAQQIPAIV
jgi:mannose-1-phosphate guanylyltransferase